MRDVQSGSLKLKLRKRHGEQLDECMSAIPITTVKIVRTHPGMRPSVFCCFLSSCEMLSARKGTLNLIKSLLGLHVDTRNKISNGRYCVLQKKKSPLLAAGRRHFADEKVL